MLGSADQLDPTNPVQMDTLHIHFSHNMALIDFWLLFCVFKKDTKQFPKNIGCSAWDLAANRRKTVVGFSGTNDNRCLMPLQVHQAETQVIELQATNGKMLDLIIQHNEYKTLAPLVCRAPPSPSLHACTRKMHAHAPMHSTHRCQPQCYADVVLMRMGHAMRVGTCQAKSALPCQTLHCMLHLYHEAQRTCMVVWPHTYRTPVAQAILVTPTNAFWECEPVHACMHAC
jgi:hypothetical protein